MGNLVYLDMVALFPEPVSARDQSGIFLRALADQRPEIQAQGPVSGLSGKVVRDEDVHGVHEANGLKNVDQWLLCESNKWTNASSTELTKHPPNKYSLYVSRMTVLLAFE